MMSSRRRGDAYARAIVRVIDADPERRGLLLAQQTLERWLSTREQPEPDLFAWREILTRPWESIRALLLSPTERAAQLRQSMPFAGLLSDEDRERILADRK